MAGHLGDQAEGECEHHVGVWLSTQFERSLDEVGGLPLFEHLKQLFEYEIVCICLTFRALLDCSEIQAHTC